MAPTLISATPSAYARINRIAFMEKGVDFTLQNEVPWNGEETQTPKYNPLEKLPILILEDGNVLYDSSHIQEYILHKYADKGPSLMPEGFEAQLRAKQIQVLAQGHMDAMALQFFETSREHSSPEWLARQSRKIEGAMRAYSDSVKAANGGWLVGGVYSIADIAVGCAVDWVDFFGLCTGWREKYAELAKWYEQLSQRETFQKTKPVMFDMKDKIV
ncbi:hypothetical protein DOTSEDRAFT_135035 [Dothistroma septosporum NZE10]|uniref:Glutathione S-transferase domain-containing protein n=1 Tax=Dothistroma septosporum (strain NZE10 / CBS 128990) TaxID=675120 RepID=N1PHK5_DOTSN|nr:hypothetical protein DOTSEDRAFT_135035 [Dothistroma septosporum NZE10]